MAVKKVFFHTLPALFLFLFLFGCTQEDIGLFYSLEVEKDLEADKGLADDLKVWEMVRSGDTYYIAAGLVYSRGISDDTWEELTPPESSMLCSDIAIFNDTIYTVYLSADGTVSKLYTLNTGNNSWNAVDSVTGDDSRIAGIMSFGDALFVTALVDDSETVSKPYSIYYTEDGSSFSAADLPGDDDWSIRIIFDGDYDGTNYWLISGDTILTGTSPGTLTDSVSPEDINGNEISIDDLGGIFYSSEIDRIFISTKKGTVMARDIPSEGVLSDDWYVSSVVYDGDDEEVFYDLTEMTIPDAAADEEIIVVAGSDNGYYEIAVTESSSGNSISLSTPSGFTPTTTINYLNTKLADNSIRNFFFDSMEDGYADDRIFGCTTSSGLWINTYNSEANQRIWSRE